MKIRNKSSTAQYKNNILNRIDVLKRPYERTVFDMNLSLLCCKETYAILVFLYGHRVEMTKQTLVE